MDTPSRRLLLFIPAFNCARQVVRVLDQLEPRVMVHIQRVLLIDNRSTDGTVEAVLEWAGQNPGLPLLLLRNDSNYSLGGSHKVAFDHALQNDFTHVLVLHGDDQADIRDLLPWLEDGRALEGDAFLGSRFARGSRLPGYSWFRILGNLVFNSLVSLVAGRRLTDLGSGLNLFRMSPLAGRSYLSFPDNLNFNVYLLLYLVHTRARFEFFPISWREEDQISNVRFVRQSLEILSVCLRYRLNRQKLFAPRRDLPPDRYTSRVLFDVTRDS
ncbi:MAG: glycosyltransferase family 2 protein [Candidatus Xenobium sp.]|nr:glycosyltransferase family 2 protein [Burkholderiales bacterium]